jgi:hypothetical protein
MTTVADFLKLTPGYKKVEMLISQKLIRIVLQLFLFKNRKALNATSRPAKSIFALQPQVLCNKIGLIGFQHLTG